MILNFTRIDHEIIIIPGEPFVLEIHDKSQFARFVESIASEKGNESKEPYIILDAHEKEVKPKKAFILALSLPQLPIDDRVLLTDLYKKICLEFANNAAGNDELSQLALQMRNRLMGIQIEMMGSYVFQIDWGIEQYLKAYSFGLDISEDNTFLERCCAFLELCADVAPSQPICFCNLKSFLCETELETLYECIFSLGEQVLMLETWHDVIKHTHEVKLVIDQQFLEN